MKKGLKVACLTGVAFSVAGATVVTMMPTEAATSTTSSTSISYWGDDDADGGSYGFDIN